MLLVSVRFLYNILDFVRKKFGIRFLAFGYFFIHTMMTPLQREWESRTLSLSHHQDIIRTIQISHPMRCLHMVWAMTHPNKTTIKLSGTHGLWSNGPHYKLNMKYWINLLNAQVIYKSVHTSTLLSTCLSINIAILIHSSWDWVHWQRWQSTKILLKTIKLMG